MPLTKIENPERILWCIWNTGYKQAQNLGRLALTLPYFSSSQILSHQMLLCLPLIAPEIFCFLIVPVLSIPFMDHSLVTAKGINSMKPCAMPCRATQDRWGHSEEFWQNVVHWRKKWQPTPVFLPGEPRDICKFSVVPVVGICAFTAKGVRSVSGEEPGSHKTCSVTRFFLKKKETHFTIYVL